MIESFIVENYSGRVDAYIPKACPDLTRSRAAQLIADGAVLIDGKPVKASFKVQGGEKIDIDFAGYTVRCHPRKLSRSKFEEI